MTIRPCCCLKPLTCVWKVSILLGLLLAWYLFCCHPARAARSRLVVCTPGPLVSLDPTNYRGRETQVILKNLCDSLTTRGPDMRVVPQLAESWHLVSDTEWEFKLREGVRFHNGRDLTAGDVKFTLDRVTMDSGIDGIATSPMQSLFGPVKEVTIKDSLTLRIRTATPWALLPMMLSLQEIVPQADMQALGTKGFDQAPVGCGPFKFVKREKDRLILERFDRYYGGSPDRPPLGCARVDTLIFRFLPSLTQRVAALKSQKCDLITDLTPDILPVLKMADHVQIMTAPATRSFFADLNCSKYPFNDRRIRQALNYAVDMPALINHIFGGHAIVLPTILLPNALGFHKNLTPYPYDPEKARLLLKQAQYPDWYIIRIACAPKYERFANTLAVFMAKAGFKTQIKVMPRDEARLSMVRLLSDILVTSWGNSTLDPSGILEPKLKSFGRGNFSQYTSKEVDGLLDQAKNTMDPGSRVRLYEKIQTIVFQDAPMLFGYAAKEYYAAHKKVKNFLPEASGMLNLHDVTVDREKGK